MSTKLIKLFLFIVLFLQHAMAADWSRDYRHPSRDSHRLSDYHRANIMELPSDEWEKIKLEGQRHVMIYPVTTTELLIPYRVLKNYFESTPNDPIRQWIYRVTQQQSGITSMQDLWSWLGVHEYPQNSTQRFPQQWTDFTHEEQDLAMGATLMERDGAQGLTFSCAGCHSADLFGKKVVGLTNRFPRANEFFRIGATLTPLINATLFEHVMQTTPAEKAMFKRLKSAVKFVGTKKPQALGLDTSLAQVALSLSRRARDEYASRFATTAAFPRPNALERDVADSKPAVWWNLKYKTRWLSDGSIVQGNPIHTNFLWNEIGRGADLKNLEKWLLDNQATIDELTATVFASEAPEYLAFLPEETLDINLAKQGETQFSQHCVRCHGQYDKAWSAPNAHTLSIREQVRTTKVWYHKQTPVIDVNTDAGRWQGMQAFADRLNELKISKSMKTIVEPQKGYVPPPLVGIWARWPYFHNNSAPSLCAVLTKSSQRPKRFVMGPAINPTTDYDSDCGGYPTVENAPEAWKAVENYWFDTTLQGLSAQGHDEGIFLKDGKELMSVDQKRALIEFLKTL